MSEKTVTNWSVSSILFLTIPSFGGTNQKSVHFVDSSESDSQAYTFKKKEPSSTIAGIVQREYMDSDATPTPYAD